MTTKTIRFDITMTPTEVPVIGAWTNAFALHKDLSGDLTGTSEGLFLNSGQTEGSRSYIVIEKFVGTTADGESASVIVEHGGLENDENACFGRIVPGTGTGAWEGIAGGIKFDGDDDGEFMVLTVNE